MLLSFAASLIFSLQVMVLPGAVVMPDFAASENLLHCQENLPEAEVLPHSERRLAQVFGNRCFVPNGWCWANPAPVGSPCFCGQLQGTIGQ